MAPNPPTCYLIDKLSPEVRIRIYQFIFGPGARAHRIEPTKRTFATVAPSPLESLVDLKPFDTIQCISTDIFAVNKLIHNESIEAFYNNKVISATFVEFERLMSLDYLRQLIRDVEIIHCNHTNPDGIVPRVLLSAQSLPRLKTFTILSEYLARTGTGEDHTTVREFSVTHGLGSVECTDVGKYKLCDYSDKITITNSKILRMWPSVVSTPDDFDALKEVMTLIDACDVNTALSNMMAWASRTSLRLWVALLQKCIDRLDHPNMYDDMPPNETTALNSFCNSLMEWSYAREEMPLHKLRSTHDMHLLDNVTEMLSVNIQSYCIRPSLDSELETQEPRWVELGHESELQRQSRSQAVYREAIETQYGMDDPIDGHRWHYNTLQNELVGSPVSSVAYTTGDILETPREMLHSTFKLHYALGLSTAPTDYSEEQTDAFNAWATKLLQRHFRFARVAEMDGLDRAPLSILRAAIMVGYSMAIMASGGLPSPQDGDVERLKGLVEPQLGPDAEVVWSQ